MFNILVNDAPFKLEYDGNPMILDYIDGRWCCVRQTNENETKYNKIEEIKFDYVETDFTGEITTETTERRIIKVSNIKDIETLVKAFSESDYKHIEFYNSYKISNSNSDILDTVEKEYLENIIAPFKNKVRGIKKCSFYDDKELEYISIILDSRIDSDIDLPHFKHNTMYRHMELGKEYSLEELGLFNIYSNQDSPLSQLSRRDLERKIIALQLDLKDYKKKDYKN